MNKILEVIGEEISNCKDIEQLQFYYDLVMFINTYDKSMEILRRHNDEIVTYNKNKHNRRLIKDLSDKELEDIVAALINEYQISVVDEKAVTGILEDIERDKDYVYSKKRKK